MSSNCTSGSTSCHFTCPNGGTWYACPNEPYFLGCCSSDPCTNSNITEPCPDVYAASFDPSIYDSIRPNTCINATSSNWYTCSDTSPPFIGCCTSNPCSDGCPAGNLRASAWSHSRGDQLELFEDAAPSGGGGGGGGGKGGLSGGAIAGIVIGCVAAVAILLFAVWFFLRRRKKQNHIPAWGAPSVEQRTVEYMYQTPASPYPDTSNPDTSVSGKYPSGSTGLSLPSPPLPSGNERNSEDPQHPQHRRSSSQDHPGLGVSGVQMMPETIPELDGTAKPREVNELDGGPGSSPSK